MRLGSKWYARCFQVLLVIVGIGALIMGLINALSGEDRTFEVKGYEVHYHGWQVYLMSAFFWVSGAGLLWIGLSDRIVKAFEGDD